VEEEKVMNRKLLAGLAGAVLLMSAGLLIGTGPAKAADQVVFQLGWFPGGYNSPPYIGVQKGLFAAENLEVKILSGRGSADTLTKLSTNVADFGEAGLDALMAAKAEGQVQATAVMAMFTQQPDALITTTTTGINTLKDMPGKSVGTSPFTSSNLPWPLVLKQAGVDPAAVRLVKVDANALFGMLAAGQVDGILVWTTTAPAAIPSLTAAGRTMKVIPWSREGYDGYSQAIVASNKTLTERPDVTRRFLKVLRQTFELMAKEPDAAAEAVKAHAPQADLGALRAQVDATVPLMINDISRRDGLGVFNPVLVQKTWEWVAKAREYPMDKMAPMSVIDGKFVGS
jgi:NitT/TauT family transport system substrate-binding protein